MSRNQDDHQLSSELNVYYLEPFLELILLQVQKVFQIFITPSVCCFLFLALVDEQKLR